MGGEANGERRTRAKCFIRMRPWEKLMGRAGRRPSSGAGSRELAKVRATGRDVQWSLESGRITPQSCPCRGPDTSIIGGKVSPVGTETPRCFWPVRLQGRSLPPPASSTPQTWLLRGETMGGRLCRTGQGAWEHGQSTGGRVLFETLSVGSTWEPTITC